MLNVRSHADQRSLALRALLVIAGAQLMWLGSKFSIDVLPVPITGQTLALPLIVAALGTWQATLAMVVYLSEGALGLPVFATGGFGIAYLLGHPSSGYLWAYPLAAFTIGSLYDRGFARYYAGRWIAIFAGTALIFAIGAGRLVPFVGGFGAAWTLGVAPFIVGDLLKISIAAGLGPSWQRIAARLGIP